MSTKYKTINGWTKARMIEQVRAKLPKDGSRCVSANGRSCLYRDSGGSSCAAGAFIPDDEYSGVLEGKDILAVIGLRSISPDVLPLVLEGMLELQVEHDNCPTGQSAMERAVQWIEKNVEDDR